MALMRCSLLAFAVVTVALAQPPKGDWPALNPNDAKLVKAGPPLPAPATAVAALDAKNLILVGCEDGSLLVYTRVADKDWIADAPKAIKAHGSGVTAVAAAGGTITSASSDGKVHVWAVPPGDKPLRAIDAKTVVRAMGLSADGKALAVTGDDGKVQLFNPADGKASKTLTGPTDWLLAVALSADGKQAAAGGQDGKLWAWDATGGAKRFDVPAAAPPMGKTPADTNVITSLAYSPDGKQLIAGVATGPLLVFQADNGKFVRAMPGHDSGVTDIWWHGGNQLIATTARDRTLHLWNPTSGAKLKTLPAHDAWATGVAGLGTGTEAVTVGADRTVKLWTLGAKVMPKKK
jgi:WD40 repeat protein